MKFVNEVAQSHQGAINVVFYYSGHCTNDNLTGESYLIPVDADSTMTELCYPLTKLYAQLKDNDVRQTIMIVDADFGATPQLPQGNTLLFCAASGMETTLTGKIACPRILPFQLRSYFCRAVDETSSGFDEQN